MKSSNFSFNFDLHAENTALAFMPRLYGDY